MAEVRRPPFRILLAGAGAFGREHLDRLMARRDVTVAGVADPSPAARAHVAARHPGLALAADIGDLLERAEADGLIVATAAPSHFAIAQAGLGRGLPVLLEKPVTPTAQEARRLAELSAAQRAPLLPGHVLRFSKDHRRLAGLVRSGAIGEVLYLSSRRYRDDSHELRYTDADPVLTTLIHDIDLAVWLMPGRFRIAQGGRAGGPHFRALTTADLATSTGARCHLRTAWTFTDGDLPPDRLEVVGDRGSIELDAGVGLTLFAAGRRTALPLAAGDDPLVNEHDEFVASIGGGGAPAVTIAEAVRGLSLADAILASLTDGGAAAVDL